MHIGVYFTTTWKRHFSMIAMKFGTNIVLINIITFAKFVDDRSQVLPLYEKPSLLTLPCAAPHSGKCYFIFLPRVQRTNNANDLNTR